MPLRRAPVTTIGRDGLLIEPEETAAVAPPAGAKRWRRSRPELLVELVFRPLAGVIVRVAAAAAGVAAGGRARERESPASPPCTSSFAASSSARALLLQLKTLLDNADGQLARRSGRTSAFGRYLDTEVDLLVNVALFAALGHVTGELDARGWPSSRSRSS